MTYTVTATQQQISKKGGHQCQQCGSLYKIRNPRKHRNLCGRCAKILAAKSQNHKGAKHQ